MLVMSQGTLNAAASTAPNGMDTVESIGKAQDPPGSPNGRRLSVILAELGLVASARACIPKTRVVMG